jgi:crotonobetainyl-CoA:carnitine CoA-transferase CaiB-like acyl-CoA transferase
MTRPLQDLVVVDFSTLLPGPMATLMLAEAGAEVIKVERPSGEDMRAYAPEWKLFSRTFAVLNRGKRSVAIDLKHPDSLTRLTPIIERADVLVEQFRPGVMARLGLGYDAIKAINPRIIYCSISAYGQVGPKAQDVGHDLNVLAETGLLTTAKAEGNQPPNPATPLGDIGGGTYPAVINILMALHERTKTGVGRHLDISLSDNLFAFSYWALAEGGTGAFPRPGGHLVSGASPRYRLYRSRDGKIIAAAPLEPKFWKAFCDILALPDLFRDDSVDPEATSTEISRRIASEDGTVWAERFAQSECCCSVAVDLEEAIIDPHFAARQLFELRVANEAGDTMPAVPMPLDPAYRLAAPRCAAAPLLGEANELLGCDGQTEPEEPERD